MQKNTLSRIVVRRRPGNPSQGWLVAGPQALPVALGRGGIKANKREGDGGTPRHACPATLLPVHRIRADDGWCEDPSSRHYNRPIKVPANSNADRLARADRLYDFIIELDHNTRPRIAGRGSAVFIHIARPQFAPTAGCVALRLDTLRHLLARLGPQTKIMVE